MHHVTLRCICVTIVVMESNKSNMYLICQMICILLYCHLWPVQLCCIFSHYLVTGMILRGGFTEHEMCVLIFSATSVYNISHSKKY